MAKQRPVDQKLLSELLDLHSFGESVVWPSGYSVDIARRVLSGGTLPSTDAASNAKSSLPTPVRATAVATTDSQHAAGKIQIYTDGSCPSNVGSAAKQGAAGWGFVVLRGGDELDFYGPVVFDKGDSLFLGCTCGTNNTGELSAIGMALCWLVEADLSNMPCTILYDSKYAANIAQAKWKAEKNEDLARTVQGFCRAAKAKRSIVFQHVKGHSGDKGNDRADKNADRGASGELQCWARPATALYKPLKTLKNMFGKRPAAQIEDDTKGSNKSRRLDGISVIEGA